MGDTWGSREEPSIAGVIREIGIKRDRERKQSGGGMCGRRAQQQRQHPNNHRKSIVNFDWPNPLFSLSLLLCMCLLFLFLLIAVLLYSTFTLLLFDRERWWALQTSSFFSPWFSFVYLAARVSVDVISPGAKPTTRQQTHTFL